MLICKTLKVIFINEDSYFPNAMLADIYRLLTSGICKSESTTVRCQKPLVKSCAGCLCLELWLQNKTEVHLGLTCLKFPKSYMQTDSNSQTGNSLNANSEPKVMEWVRSSPRTRQLLFHFNICSQMRLQVVNFHPSSAIWKIQGCAHASIRVAPYCHHRVECSH